MGSFSFIIKRVISRTMALEATMVIPETRMLNMQGLVVTMKGICKNTRQILQRPKTITTQCQQMVLTYLQEDSSRQTHMCSKEMQLVSLSLEICLITRSRHRESCRTRSQPTVGLLRKRRRFRWRNQCYPILEVVLEPVILKIGK